ncbi:DedA family protein [Nonomuraea candida]|uniref:DedA family protein n=1 Tax=Nonomuraea candida TaxID=359159 RepID=UPI0006946758|nr:DedA family protein [Nonomuraea candida]
MDWITEYVNAVSDLPFPLVGAVAALMAFAESGLGVGSVLPGETGVLLLGATVTGPVRFAAMLLLVALGVTGGDHVGYVLGRRYGDRMRRLKVVRRLGVHHWDRARAALQRHGATAVFVTRLIPIVRTLTPAAAGAAQVTYRRFLIASLAGSLLWSGVYVSLGALAGASAAQLERTLGRASWLVLGGVVVVVAGVGLLRRRRASAKRREEAGDADLRERTPATRREQARDVGLPRPASAERRGEGGGSAE